MVYSTASSHICQRHTDLPNACSHDTAQRGLFSYSARVAGLGCDLHSRISGDPVISCGELTRRSSWLALGYWLTANLDFGAVVEGGGGKRVCIGWAEGGCSCRGPSWW